MTFRQKLIAIGACDDAVAWVGDRTLEQAWAECGVPGWMMWLCRKTGLRDHHGLSIAAADIAESVWHLVQADAQLACAWAIDTARRHGRGECDGDEWRAATYAAALAADAADAASQAQDRASCDAIRRYVSVDDVRVALGRIT